MLASLHSTLSNLGVSDQTLLVFGIGLGAFIAIFGVISAFSARDPVLSRIALQAAKRPLSSFDAGLLRAADSNPTGWMRTLIPGDKKERTQIQRQLAEAGVNGPHAVRNYYLLRMLLGLVLPFILVALIGASRAGWTTLPDVVAEKVGSFSQMQLLQMLSVLIAVGFFGPVYWLRGRVSARRQAIEQAFPNVLDLLQISVESGLGMDAAMIRVANETTASAPEISEEFMITQREIQAGRSRDKALLDMAERTGVAQVNSFANVVLQSIHFGSSIADALTVYSEEMRQWRELRAQEMANKLPVKMSAIMASLMLPALLILALGPVVIRYMRYMGS